MQVREDKIVQREAQLENEDADNKISKQLVKYVLQAAYLSGTVGSIALASNLKRKQVRSVQKCGALVWLEKQSAMLKRIKDEVESKILRVLVFVDRMESDSSKQSMRIKAHPLLSHAQQKSSWDVIVTL